MSLILIGKLDDNTVVIVITNFIVFQAFADIPDSTEDRAAWKMIGELNFTPFMDAMEEKYNCEEQEEAYLLAVPVYDVWEGYLRDPQWHPLKVVNVDGQPKVC